MARPYRTVETDRDVFRALGHPARRRMVSAALAEPRSFAQMCRLVRRTPPTVAGHLRILREARIIAAVRAGRSVIYRADPSALRASAKWLTSLSTAQAAAHPSDAAVTA